MFYVVGSWFLDIACFVVGCSLLVAGRSLLDVGYLI